MSNWGLLLLVGPIQRQSTLSKQPIIKWRPEPTLADVPQTVELEPLNLLAFSLADVV